jgi:hypothetical protein
MAPRAWFEAHTAEGVFVHGSGCCKQLVAWLRRVVMDGSEDLVISRGRRVVAVACADGRTVYLGPPARVHEERWTLADGAALGRRLEELRDPKPDVTSASARPPALTRRLEELRDGDGPRAA